MGIKIIEVIIKGERESGKTTILNIFMDILKKEGYDIKPIYDIKGGESLIIFNEFVEEEIKINKKKLKKKYQKKYNGRNKRCY